MVKKSVKKAGTPRGEILEDARVLTEGDRNKTYGSVYESCKRVGDLWSAYLQTPVSPLQVAQMMVLFKVARSVASPKHLDNYVDAAAYAAIAGEISEH